MEINEIRDRSFLELFEYTEYIDLSFVLVSIFFLVGCVGIVGMGLLGIKEAWDDQNGGRLRAEILGKYILAGAFAAFGLVITFFMFTGSPESFNNHINQHFKEVAVSNEFNLNENEIEFEDGLLKASPNDPEVDIYFTFDEEGKPQIVNKEIYSEAFLNKIKKTS